MDWNTLNPVIVPAIVALFGGIIGYFLKYYLDKKAQFVSNNADVKRSAYQKFVNVTASFFIKSKQSKRVQDNAVDELGEFYKQYVLYGSPKVVRSFANLMQVFYKREALKITKQDMTRAEQRYMFRSMTRVYKAMRKDIGLSNRTLGFGGASLMRAIITDYDHLMRPKFVVWLSLFLMSFRNHLGRSNITKSEVQEDELHQEDNEKEDVTSALLPLRANKSKKSKRKKR